VSIKNTDSPLQGLIHYQEAQQKDPGISRMTFPACPLGFGPLQGFLFVVVGENFRTPFPSHAFFGLVAS
jgi:hypothetical protein